MNGMDGRQIGIFHSSFQIDHIYDLLLISILHRIFFYFWVSIRAPCRIKYASVILGTVGTPNTHIHFNEPQQQNQFVCSHIILNERA